LETWLPHQFHYGQLRHHRLSEEPVAHEERIGQIAVRLRRGQSWEKIRTIEGAEVYFQSWELLVQCRLHRLIVHEVRHIGAPDGQAAAAQDRKTIHFGNSLLTVRGVRAKTNQKS
jgi:hypothetical protein